MLVGATTYLGSCDDCRDHDASCTFNCILGLVCRVLHSRTSRSRSCDRTTRGVCFCLVKTNSPSCLSSAHAFSATCVYVLCRSMFAFVGIEVQAPQLVLASPRAHSADCWRRGKALRSGRELVRCQRLTSIIKHHSHICAYLRGASGPCCYAAQLHC